VKIVIELIADDSTNKEIAENLNLSPFTVKSHIHNILEKLTLHTAANCISSHKSDTYKLKLILLLFIANNPYILPLKDVVLFHPFDGLIFRTK